MTDKRLSRRAQALLALYAPHFGLVGWTMGVKVCEKEEVQKGADGGPDENYYSAVFSDPASRKAIVLINRGIDWEHEDLEASIVHELVHVAENKSGLAALMVDLQNAVAEQMGRTGRNLLESQFLRANEDFINDMAQTIVQLRKGR